MVVANICFFFTPTWENEPIWRPYFLDELKPPSNDRCTGPRNRYFDSKTCLLSFFLCSGLQYCFFLRRCHIVTSPFRTPGKYEYPHCRCLKHSQQIFPMALCPTHSFIFSDDKPRQPRPTIIKSVTQNSNLTSLVQNCFCFYQCFTSKKNANISLWVPTVSSFHSTFCSTWRWVDCSWVHQDDRLLLSSGIAPHGAIYGPRAEEIGTSNSGDVGELRSFLLTLYTPEFTKMTSWNIFDFPKEIINTSSFMVDFPLSC